MSEPMFTYNASALGLGGVLKRDGVTTIIPSLASVTLAPTGGRGSNEICGYNKDGVSFSSARSEVFGFQSGRLYTTISDIYITNLNLFDRIEVDLMQTSMTSTREVEDLDAELLTVRDLENLATPDRTSFEVTALVRGFRIDGVEVVPQFDSELCLANNFTGFTQMVGGPRLLEYAEKFGTTETKLRNTIDSKLQPIRGSLLERAAHDEEQTAIGRHTGYTLPVTGFGKVHIGELIVKPNRRRLNLLRIDFNRLQPFVPFVPGFMDAVPSDPPPEGSMTVMSGDGNGAPVWG